MAMETLGGNLPTGRPVALFAGGKTHVFAIGAGGMMNHWTSSNGIDWQGPGQLVRLNTNLEPSYPCAIALGNAVHLFAIGNGGPLSNGGPLVHWFSPDGANFVEPVEDRASPIPGGANGIAACSPNPNRIDAFAVTPSGLVRYSYAMLASLGAVPVLSSGLSGALPRCVPAAVSSDPGVMDVFVIDADGSVLRWRSTNGLTGATTVLPPPPGTHPGRLVRSGFAAVSPAPGRIELFAITTGSQVTHWSIDRENVTEVSFLPIPPEGIGEGVPAAIVVDGRVEVFAIGRPPNPVSGAPLLRWRRRDGGDWSSAKVIGASLSAGGLGAAASGSRIDAFGLAGGGLQHWPAGIAAATNEPWANWANNLQANPGGLCYPSTEEEVVAIVKTAETAPGVRVRAVGSSWSFTDITAPPAPGFIVETNRINGLITHVLDGSVLTENAPDPRYLIHVEAGIQVEQLMLILDAMGLAPFTMGGSSGQTLAGVISTSVHGGHWDRGPIPNAVRAIQIVGPGGTRHWIEPDQWRITREDELRKRLGPDVQIRYDDDWFDAMLVSMGSMGIITSVVLEVTDQYFLRKSCVETTWAALRPELEQGTLFADPDHYVMIAIDPAQVQTEGRSCYVTTSRRSDGSAISSGPTDLLAAYCLLDLEDALGYLTGLGVAAPILEGALSVITATAGAFGIPLPAGTTLAAALPILVAALKARGAGAVGDFLGDVLEQSPEVAAAFASRITRLSLNPGQSSEDVAHRILAPANLGECATRGLGVELAFDAMTGAYLTYVDEAMKLLNQRRQDGLVLGGWFSLRFVGPSRAILSPQQYARTCMVEFVGLRSMNSTAQLLNELEQLGKSYGGIQHWGMFGIPNLAAGDLPRAYPRLDTWRRVRRELTSGGTIRTFENNFTARLGLDSPPAGTPLVWQQDWKWCSKCLGMAYAGGAPGPCPAGGHHDHRTSGNYGFTHNAPWAPGQRRWRWCSKCMGMTFENTFAAPCPAGGAHDNRTSGEYTILRNGQSNWRWCNKCQSIALAIRPGSCPAGGMHDHNGSGNYWLAFTPLTPPPAPPHTTPPGAVTLMPQTPLRPPAELRQPTESRPVELTVTSSILTALLRTELPYSVPETPGERGWRQCSRCQGLTRAGGICAGGAPHLNNLRGSYIIPMNAPTVPGHAHWRLCKKCLTLAFRGGVCFDGGTHDFRGSGDYALHAAGQNQWRHCKNCNGLWFRGNGGRGRCPSLAGVHDPGIDDYVIVPRQ